MSDYRLYFMTEDGHIQRGIDLECRDDAHAVTVIEERREAGPLELWQGARHVKDFPAKVAE